MAGCVIGYETEDFRARNVRNSAHNHKLTNWIKKVNNKMTTQEKEFYEEYLALFEEYELLEPDNDYAWDSWVRRAMLLIIKQRLYDFIKEKGDINIHEIIVDKSEQDNG